MTADGAVDEAADEILAANAAFYAALESCDLDAMANVWEQSERAVVVHPGWPMLRGWNRVAESWAAIFRNTDYIQFVITDETCVVAGDTGWVTAQENILQSAGGGAPASDDAELTGSRAVVTNVFVRDGTDWRMVVHHASPV